MLHTGYLVVVVLHTDHWDLHCREEVLVVVQVHQLMDLAIRDLTELELVAVEVGVVHIHHLNFDAVVKVAVGRIRY